LVFDFGGGTFDVTVLTTSYGNFEVKATLGDMHLGGDDVTRCLMEYVLEALEKEHGADVIKDEIRNKAKAIDKLRRACETAKRSFTGAAQYDLQFDHDDYEFQELVTRAKFDELCKALF